MFWSTLLVLALGSPATAAAPNPATATAPDPATAKPPLGITKELSPLDLSPVAEKQLPPSRVPVTIAVDLEWAKAELSQRVPQLLHQESNREVSPGIWIDAKVTRGAIELRIRDDGVTGLVPVLLDLDVRSKLGGMTLRLGRCQTTIDVELNLPTKLAEDGTWSRPNATTTLREPCRLSGFDVTSILQREIGQRMAEAEARVSEHMARANAILKQLHGELYRRFDSAVVGCNRFVPHRLLQVPLVLEQGVVLGRLSVEGTFVNSCQASEPARLVVAPVAKPTGFDLVWITRLPLSEVQAILAQRLAESAIGGTIREVRAVRRDDVEQLAIFVEVAKTKGWVFAEPALVANTLTLRSVDSLNRELRTRVKPIFEAIALPIDTIGAETLGQKVLEASNAASQGFGRPAVLLQRHQTSESSLRTQLELIVEPNALVVAVHRREPVANPAD